MRFRKSLPLGIDIGVARVRIARLERNGAGEIRLAAVAARDMPETTQDTAAMPEMAGALFEEMVAELGTRERRCVFALPVSDATLRAIAMPNMGWNERRRAARFEAPRIASWDVEREESIVRVHPTGVDNVFAVGVARAAVVKERVRALRGSGLRTIAADHAGCAAFRAFADVDAVLDIGFGQTALHTRSGSVASTFVSPAGGHAVTLAISKQLSIDATIAERRKRILGTAGAGDQALRALAGDTARLISDARERSAVDRIAVIGNASRLPGLLTEIEHMTGALMEIPVSDLLQGGSYPDDIVRSAAPDWTMAAALAAWHGVE